MQYEKIEQWKPVVDWINYEISDKGNVRGKHGKIKTFKILGYISFNVAKGRMKRKSLRVHREVLKAFKGNIHGLCVRHLDGNKENCCLENLAWGTHKENESDKRRHGRNLAGERHHQHILTLAQVRNIRKSPLQSIHLAKLYNVHKDTVYRIRQGRGWKGIV